MLFLSLNFPIQSQKPHCIVIKNISFLFFSKEICGFDGFNRQAHGIRPYHLVRTIHYPLPKSRAKERPIISIKNVREVLKFTKARWKEHFPGVPMEFSFLDEEFDRVYRYEEQMGKLLGIITFLGLIIACLGLFGLISFMVHLRKKEMGIRKVLGASKSNIIKLLSKKYFVLIALSSIFSFPLAWFAINKWLQDFAYRIKPGISVFLITGVLALIISISTIAFMGSRAASRDPIDTLTEN